MTGFLDRLAGIALGDTAPGAARVALPPRFAPSPAVADMARARRMAPEDDSAAAFETPPVEAPQFSMLRGEEASTAREGERPVRAAGVEVPHRPGVGMHAVLNFPSAAGADTAMLAMKTSAPARPANIGIASALPAVDATSRDVPAAPRHPSTAPAVDHPRPPRIEARPVPRTLRAAAARAAPLSDAAVAGRVSDPRDDRPVIHVTIDRIDVRAPAAARSAPAPRPPRREPMVSLSEYLRRSEPGGRA